MIKLWDNEVSNIIRNPLKATLIVKDKQVKVWLLRHSKYVSDAGHRLSEANNNTDRNIRTCWSSLCCYRWKMIFIMWMMMFDTNPSHSIERRHLTLVVKPFLAQ